MRTHHISFIHAIDGLRTAFRTQPNFQIHLALSSVALLLSLVFQISLNELAIILFTIAAGLAIELLNTSIEFTVDLLTSKYDILAKYAKDTAAAAMLVYAFFACAIALVIFYPRFLVLLWPSI